MKLRYFFFIILFTSSLLSCRSSKSASDNTADKIESTGTTASEKPQNDGEAQIEKSVFATIHRGACFGTCPTYKMTIYTDRSVEYEGIRAVDLIGKYTSAISEQEYDQFIAVANEIEYMSLEDVYDGPITDIPGTRTSIVLDGVRKEVYRRYQYPKRILKFEELFDNVMKTASWEKVQED